MTTLKLRYLIGILFALAAASATAQPPSQPGQPGQPGPALPAGIPAPAVPVTRLEADTDLIDLLRSVEARTGRRFTIHPSAPQGVTLGSIPVEDIDYERLKIILDNYGFVVIEQEDWVNVVPTAEIRQRATRVVTPAMQDDVSADEVVTMVIALNNIGAANLVPILRPMMPQAAHLAAFPQANALIVVDRNDNVQRMLAVVTELDRPDQ